MSTETLTTTAPSIVRLASKGVACAWLICSFSVAATAEDLSLDVAEWPPYITESQMDGGLLSEITLKAFDRVGVSAKLVFKSWPRVTFDIDNNQGVSFGWIKNDERLDKWHYSQVILEGVTGFFYHREEPIAWEKLDDLAEQTIAVSAGYSYGDRFDQAKPRLTLHENASDLVNLNMLLHRRVKLAIMDPLVGKYLIERNFAVDEARDLVFDWERPVKQYTLHLVCARTFEDCERLVRTFNEGLQTLKTSGQYDALVRSAYGSESLSSSQ